MTAEHMLVDRDTGNVFLPPSDAGHHEAPQTTLLNYQALAALVTSSDPPSGTDNLSTVAAFLDSNKGKMALQDEQALSR
jgi:hypothetical protein